MGILVASRPPGAFRLRRFLIPTCVCIAAVSFASSANCTEARGVLVARSMSPISSIRSAAPRMRSTAPYRFQISNVRLSVVPALVSEESVASSSSSTYGMP